jgi:hypothetical protein
VKTPVKSIRAAGIAAALLAVLAANDAAAAKIYRCVDSNKKVTVSDRPCNENAPAAAAADKAAPADTEKKDGKASPPKKDEKKDGKKG